MKNMKILRKQHRRKKIRKLRSLMLNQLNKRARVKVGMNRLKMIKMINKMKTMNIQMTMKDDI